MEERKRQRIECSIMNVIDTLNIKFRACKRDSLLKKLRQTEIARLKKYQVMAIACRKMRLFRKAFSSLLQFHCDISELHLLVSQRRRLCVMQDFFDSWNQVIDISRQYTAEYRCRHVFRAFHLGCNISQAIRCCLANLHFFRSVFKRWQSVAALQSSHYIRTAAEFYIKKKLQVLWVAFVSGIQSSRFETKVESHKSYLLTQIKELMDASQQK